MNNKRSKTIILFKADLMMNILIEFFIDSCWANASKIIILILRFNLVWDQGTAQEDESFSIPEFKNFEKDGLNGSIGIKNGIEFKNTLELGTDLCKLELRS
jgi:hypothetical protein